jgi:Cu+-exporting ATPase
VGSVALLADLGADPAALQGRAEVLRAEGQTVLFVAVDGRPGSWASPIRSSLPRRKPCTRCATKAFA